jgi:methionine synthase II (cobalamin-independent)
LREHEDTAAARALALQREVGIEVFTDGEVRRGTWMAGLLESLDGVVPVEVPTGSGWHRDHDPDPSEEETHWQLVSAAEKVRRKVRLTAIEAGYLARHAPGRFKITMMSASMGGLLRTPGLSAAAYPAVTVAMHLCRGNNRSAWLARGGCEPLAEKRFGEGAFDRFPLEYDTERSGGFEPLRFVPPGKTVVLGLVSSKVPRLESQDELRRRIEEAARYLPREQLALSPRCGFASTAPGNLLTVDEQRRRLELVVETARKVWGEGVADAPDPVPATPPGRDEAGGRHRPARPRARLASPPGRARDGRARVGGAGAGAVPGPPERHPGHAPTRRLATPQRIEFGEARSTSGSCRAGRGPRLRLALHGRPTILRPAATAPRRAGPGPPAALPRLPARTRPCPAHGASGSRSSRWCSPSSTRPASGR